MDTKTTGAKKNASPDAYTLINDKIIEQLRKGIVPWRMPWTDAGIPTSLISGNPYRGINVMLLAMLRYERNLFLTEKQLKDIGGSITPGERPHMISYWSRKSGTNGEAEMTDGKQKTHKFLYYQVYNIGQCAGISVPERESLVNPSCESIEAEILNGPSIRHKDPTPFYDPLEDYVNMPKVKTFDSTASYYRTLFHELVHSTGHHTRLDRMGLVQMSEYGADSYSLEELVAEIGGAFLESHTGIATKFEPKPEYVQGWISKLQKDSHFIFTAATLAQKATDFILNIQADIEEKPVMEEAVVI